MDDKERKFYLHKHYLIEPKSNKKSIIKKQKVYELIFILNKQRVIYGNYALCKHYLNNKLTLPERKNYKIVELK